MKIVFAGTPAFAVPSLVALCHSEHEVLAVYTQPDRPAGRGQQVSSSAVKVYAESQQLAVRQPTSLRDSSESQALADFAPDVMVVVAYGLILPKRILSIPRHGCINVHPSLLPRWRGAAPIQATLLAGDAQTGVTIMQMDAGMDTGPLLKQQTVTLDQAVTSGELHNQLAEMGGDLLLATLAELSQLSPQPQDDTQATYSQKITKSMAAIDWQHSAAAIVRQVRAFNPWPVAYTIWQGKPLKIWRASSVSSQTLAQPGSLVAVHKDAIEIATGEGHLLVHELQLPSRQKQSAKDFINAAQDKLVIASQFGEM